MEVNEFFLRWARWRRTHDFLRETTDALQLALVTTLVWIVLGKTAGLSFAGISVVLIVVGLIATLWKRHLEHRHGRLM